MAGARSVARPLSALLVLAGLLGCRPDLPGRGCKTDEDCFTQEVCTDSTCATRVSGGGAGGEASGGGSGGSGSGGGGGSPSPVPDAGAPLDAGAPDATP